MGFTLSHSSYGRFVTCPKSFKFHYIDKLRPLTSPSHLIFGSAVDKGINALIEGKDPMAEAEVEFNRLLTEPVEFFRSDYDPDLIDEETKTTLQAECSTIAGIELMNIDDTAASLLRREYLSLSEKQVKVLAKCCVTSLKIKAELMFEAYREQVLPKIKRVVSNQESIRWTDEHGNSFVGVLDLVVDLEGHGVIPADNKTASRPYDQDSVGKSTQLAVYSKLKQTTKAAFFVMDKNIKKNRVKVCSVCKHDGTGGRHKTCDNQIEGKRCGGVWNETIRPEASIQIIVGDVSPHLQDMTLEALSETSQLIKANHFPRNLNACDNQFGRPCPFREYCWRGDATGLEVQPSKEKK